MGEGTERNKLGNVAKLGARPLLMMSGYPTTTLPILKNKLNTMASDDWRQPFETTSLIAQANLPTHIGETGSHRQNRAE